MKTAASTMGRVSRLLPPGLRDTTVTYSKTDLVAVALVAGVVSAWATTAGGSFSPRVLLACEAVFLAFYLAGSLVAGVPALAQGVLFELPLRLVVGYAVVNTALLVLAWLSPLDIVQNFAVVFGLLTVAFALARKREQRTVSAASLLAMALCAVATTLWCQDSLDPVVEHGGVVVFKPWIDGFYHAVHIRIFAEGHGASTLEDFRMAGVPARLYHYGMYQLPAFIKGVSALPSYTAFAGILAPVGVFFTGLAAYAFFGSLWGAWPGVAACAALLLLPDGSQQGMLNPFLSYHWLTQISPSATYGLALLAVAWLFVIQGSLQGNRAQLLVGWGVAGVLVAYKLHYVIASALLLLLVPALFFRAPLSFGRRALWGVVACGFYAAALTLGQRVPGVPLIRFDGSGVGELLYLVGSFHVPGSLRDLVVDHLGRDVPTTTNLLLGVPYVLFAVLGISVPLLVVLVVALRGRLPLLHRLFPLLLVLNFLLMFFGLALDMRSSTPDELLHRPLMIVYFFVVAWVGGALGLLLESSRRLGRVRRPLLLGLVTVSLIVPALLGRGVQLMWSMPKISPARFPSSLIHVADYLRTHGDARDLFQDSQFDRFYVIAALSERRTFVAHTMTTMPYRAELVATRSAAVDRLLLLRQPQLVVGTARAYGIRWFVRQRGDRVNWASELANRPAFEEGPFTVYDFE
jgi:hypothetical protein